MDRQASAQDSTALSTMHLLTLPAARPAGISRPAVRPSLRASPRLRALAPLQPVKRAVVVQLSARDLVSVRKGETEEPGAIRVSSQ